MVLGERAWIESWSTMGRKIFAASRKQEGVVKLTVGKGQIGVSTGTCTCIRLLYSRPVSMPFFPCTNHFTLKMVVARSSKTLVSYPITTWHHNPEDHSFNEHLIWDLRFLWLRSLGHGLPCSDTI